MQRRPTFATMLFELFVLVTLVSVIAFVLSRIWLRGSLPSQAAAALPTASSALTIPTQLDSPETVYSSISLTPIVITNEVSRSSNNSQPQPSANPLVGRAAPDFTLPRLDGDEITLSSLAGQPVLLNFWTSWCGPCRIETPMLIEAYQRYRDDGLLIIGVNYTEQDQLEEVDAFVNSFDIPYLILLDREGHISRDAYGLIGLPMSVFIDRVGLVKQVVIGPLTNEQIDQYIAEILVEDA